MGKEGGLYAAWIPSAFAGSNPCIVRSIGTTGARFTGSGFMDGGGATILVDAQVFGACNVGSTDFVIDGPTAQNIPADTAGGSGGDGFIVRANAGTEAVRAKIRNVNTSNTVRGGITFTGCLECELVNAHVLDVTGTNPGFGLGIEPDTGEEVRGLRVSGLHVDNALRAVVAVGSGDGIGGTVIEGLHSKNIRGAPILLNGATGITFVAPEIDERSNTNGQPGAEIYSTSADIAFLGGTFDLTGATDDRGGMRISGGVTRLLVDGTIIKGTAQHCIKVVSNTAGGGVTDGDTQSLELKPICVDTVATAETTMGAIHILGDSGTNTIFNVAVGGIIRDTRGGSANEFGVRTASLSNTENSGIRIDPSMIIAGVSTPLSGNLPGRVIGVPAVVPLGTSSGQGGQVLMRELLANGLEYVGLAAPDAVTTSRVHTLPETAAADTVALIAATQTLTNKTVDVEGTGNVITTVEKKYIIPAICTNATAVLMVDTPAANAAAAACITGSGTQKAVMDFDQTTDESFETHMALPSDWTGAIDVTFFWIGNASTDPVAWCAQLVPVAAGESDDASYPAQGAGNCVSDASINSAVNLNTASKTGLTCTGCAAGELLHIRISRDPDETAGATDTMAADARLVGFELTYRRAQ